MAIYGGKGLAQAFRMVRLNTIAIATDIPADQYSFKPTPEMKSAGEQLAHIAVSTGWQIVAHTERAAMIDFDLFRKRLAEAAAAEQTLLAQGKDAVIRALEEEGERFAAFCESLTDDVLAETVAFPPPVLPSTKTRLEMLLSVKEHEMHHRGQLMVYERLLGIVPHLTRRREAARAAALAASAPAAAAQ